MSDNSPTSGIGKATGRIGALFNKKILGVKALYWFAVFALGLAFYAWKMRDTATEVTEADAATTAGDAETTDDLTAGDSAGLTTDFADAYPTPPSGTVVVQQPSNNGTGASNSAITTNEQWLSAGVAFLIGQGTSAGDAQRALQAYLQGGQLSVNQGKMRDAVIRQFGLPPYLQDISTNPDSDTPSAAQEAAAAKAAQRAALITKVKGWYFEYLGRPAKGSESEYWAGLWEQGATENQIRYGIAASNEAVKFRNGAPLNLPRN